ncbi:MAG: hypothetical protein Q4G64_03620 [bacterium]|nr:hypothetical protein [bacterium]
MFSLRKWRIGAGAAALAVGLTACSGGSDPVTPTSPAQTSVEAPTPGPVVTPGPATPAAEPTSSPADAEPTTEPTVAPTTQPSLAPTTEPEPTPTEGNVPTEGGPAVVDAPERPDSVQPLRETTPEPEAPEMSEDGPGLFAFTGHVMDVINWTAATGDTAELESICLEMTGYCEYWADVVNAIATDDLTIYGGAQYVTMDNLVINGPTDGKARVHATVITDETWIEDSSGTLQVYTPRLTEDVYFDFEWVDGEWKLVDSFLD